MYRSIYADPPWNESGGGRVKRGADRHYPLMKTQGIAALNVEALADPVGCHLWLWATNNFLPDGLAVMRAWGFRYVTNLAWTKRRNGKLQRGLGQYLRGSHELLLLGVRGRLPYRTRPDGKRVALSSVVEAPRTQHSAKPDEARAVVEAVSHAPRIELFARSTRPGWAVWGNEVDSDPVASLLLATTKD